MNEHGVAYCGTAGGFDFSNRLLFLSRRFLAFFVLHHVKGPPHSNYRTPTQPQRTTQAIRAPLLKKNELHDESAGAQVAQW